MPGKSFVESSLVAGPRVGAALPTAMCFTLSSALATCIYNARQVAHANVALPGHYQ